jgi:ABC-2 type transport system permease protein
MKKSLQGVRNARFWSLARKDLHQISRDRRLLISLLVPPTLQVILFGFSLSARVDNLSLAVVDESRTPESRQLISALTESRAFRLKGSYETAKALEAEFKRGKLDAGLAIPWDYAKRQIRGDDVRVQLLLNGVNTNTAQIAQGYAMAVIAWMNEHHTGSRIAIGDLSSEGLRKISGGGAASVHAAILYNPGLKTSWFVITGVFGVLLILNGSIVSSATMIREKDTGTIEQLLMTPASTLEIVCAKVVPLFCLMMMSASLVIIVARLVFGLPCRGSLSLLFGAIAFCVLAGIGLGTLIATLTRTANQAQLLILFLNPPLASLSGAFTPVEAIPAYLQPLTSLNPIRHFSTIARSVLVKGAGIDVVYPQLAALAAIALVLIAVSTWRFRRMMS